MGYNPDELFSQIRDVIEDENLFIFGDVAERVGVDIKTLYNHFPVGSERMSEIKRMLQKNKVDTRVGLRKRLYQSDSPTALIALYKIVATDEERAALNGKQTPTRGGAAECDSSGLIVRVDDCYGKLVAMLKENNRYSEVQEPIVYALASDMATLMTANNVIDKLADPYIIEETSQGCKLIEHPAYATREKALSGIWKHYKALGMDFGNAPELSGESPLETITRKLLDTK